jgi:hypothetical protein
MRATTLRGLHLAAGQRRDFEDRLEPERRRGVWLLFRRRRLAQLVVILLIHMRKSVSLLAIVKLIVKLGLRKRPCRSTCYKSGLPAS